MSANVHRVTELVRSLETAGLQELRAEWKQRYGKPPKLRSVELLRRLLAWRIQTDAFGGFDADTKRKLASTKPANIRPSAAPGMRLAREWKGRRYEVTVTDDGPIFEGERYSSLSAVARAITGTRWNGQRFFGLREQNVR
ncbi:hypothetical protein B5C34_13535 [Pacificimonas flava]|uniref:DUF2924 domain-containing protein n=2 Tax=Pacificimonas TaxID=1960290 RepID=A0A219B983_9SPHN|nr:MULTISPECIES: DUF2924 domain-containing protein [Pacificimonas]MBZ6379846.1 DUF2924 domain-containing protein [Pacificimonas aurantium]OWV34379.1 hypothetical protein B5C34_13535 [Pacificimonas flava]